METQQVSAKKKKQKDPIGLWQIVKVCYPLVFRSCPVYYCAQQVVAVGHGLSHAVKASVMMVLFDAVTGAAAGAPLAQQALTWFVIYILLGVAIQVLNGVHNFMHGVVEKYVKGRTSVLVHQKTSRIDPIEFENPSRLDDIEKAFKGVDNAFMFVLTTTTLLDFYLPYFIYMGFFLFRVHPVLIFALVAAFLPALISQLVRTKIMSKLEDQAAPLRREYEAQEAAICDIKFFKETRILGAFPYLMRQYRDSIARLNRKSAQAKRKSEWLMLGLTTLTLVFTGFVIGFSVVLLINGQISVGAFAAVYQSINLVFGIMEEIVTWHLGSVAENLGTIRNLIRFLRMPERSGETLPMQEHPGVAISHVSFRYPGAQHDALTDVSIDIRPGETIAIVGENGAGKTTLVRLMTGTYRPTQGTLTVGGVDTVAADPRCIQGSITGVFQKYQRYKMTLDENIRISQHGKDDSIAPVAERAGVEIGDQKRYPDGPDTMLSREFDGVDLSGGQWQRVALARGFFRDHSLIVLDEPTAAIDPIEESRIYRQFMEIARDKTAVIVTHRMGSATIADRVVVMDQGQVNDIGTHEDLMARKGLYYEMFIAQSSWYQQENAGA